MRPAGVAVAAVLLAASTAGAVPTNVAGNTAEFLLVGPGGRALGMGDAAGPVAEGAEAMYWNPGGLATAASPEVFYSHQEMLEYFRHDYLSYAHPVEALGGTLAGSVTMWTMDSLDARTASNVSMGKFSPHSEAFSIGYARTFWKGSDLPARDREFFQEKYDLPFTPRPLQEEELFWSGVLRAGGAIKVVTETIRDRSATAVAFDGGGQYVPVQFPAATLSMTLRNIGTRPIFIRDRGTLPMELDVGLAYGVHWEGHRVLPTAELAVPYYGDPYVKLGVEYMAEASKNTTVMFRAGYKTVSAPYLSPIAGATVGIGFRVRHFNADVGFQPMSELENVLRVSLGYKF